MHRVLVLGLKLTGSLLLLLGTLSCEGHPTAPAPSPADTMAGHVLLVIHWPFSVKTAADAIDSIAVHFYAAGGEEIAHGLVQRSGDRGRATLRVLAGTNRTLDLAAFSSGLVAYIGRAAGLDVVPGDTTVVEVNMLATVPELQGQQGRGELVMVWGAVHGVSTYLIETSRSETFEQRTAMDTAATARFVADSTLQGQYVRVRAATPYGFGPWSRPYSIAIGDPLGDAEIQGTVVDSTGDAQVIGSIEEGTGDAEIIGAVGEDNTGDAQVIGQIEE